MTAPLSPYSYGTFNLNDPYRIYIGIDPGTDTGFAVWDKQAKKFITLKTLYIHRAMEEVLKWHQDYGEFMFVRFEDARLRKWFGNKTDAQKQGAGSIKRDCCIWQHFLNDHKINFASTPPRKGMTKWSADYFKMQTGWDKITSTHSRDAALLVWMM